MHPAPHAHPPTGFLIDALTPFLRGWLLIMHGVGPMRKYCLGAVLLDLDDPSRVIGRQREPLLRPAPDEREGYVPNVV
jgi:predicted GH43/DUF377 family glycosyl hydrolase